jgi:hypothetical protein
VTSAKISMGVQVSPLYADLDSVGMCSGVVKLDQMLVLIFSVLRNLHNDSQSGEINLHSHQKRCKDCFSLHRHLRFGRSVLDKSRSDAGETNLSVVSHFPYG